MELETELCKINIQESSVLLIEDTSFFNFESNKGKLKANDPNLGYLNKDRGIGFGLHTSLLVSRTTCLPVGVGAYEFLVRPFDRNQAHYKDRPADERESSKWFSVLKRTRDRIPLSCQIIVVCDRESDVYGFIN